MNLLTAIQKAIRPLSDRVYMTIGRGVLRAWSEGGMPAAQTTGLPGEVLDGIEAHQSYGHSSHPLPGADTVFVCLNGTRGKAVILAVHDRRYRIELQPGEVAMSDDLGQKVHLTRDGIVAETPLTATVLAGPLVRIEADHVQFHARQKMSWDINGYGWHIRHVADVTWEQLTWQQGAVMAPTAPLPISPPEGPPDGP